jgi:hypothetical protein
VKTSRREVRVLGEPRCGINTVRHKHSAALTQRLVCRPSKPGMRVRFPHAAPRKRVGRRELYGCSTGLLIQGYGVRAPGGAPSGRDGNRHTWPAQTRPLESSNLSARTGTGRVAGTHPDPDSGPRWFDSSPGSCQLRQAAAHGCGPAFVRRAVRVGTGRRLRCPRSPIGRRHQHEGLGSVRSSRTEDTMPS